MSEQQIGRSPFAVIAELASVIVVTFYLYDYSFFHGFMVGVNHQFLALFSARDVIDYLPWSLQWFGVFVISSLFVAAWLLVCLFISDWMPQGRFFPIKYQLIVACVFCVTAPLYLAGEILKGNILAEVGGNADTGRAMIIGTAISWGWNVTAIMLVIWSFVNRRPIARFGRPAAYLLFFAAEGFAAYSTGAIYAGLKKETEVLYCVQNQGEPFEGKLLIASDQNALFLLDYGELRALSFNAIKSISNKPCPPDGVTAKQP